MKKDWDTGSGVIIKDGLEIGEVHCYDNRSQKQRELDALGDKVCAVIDSCDSLDQWDAADKYVVLAIKSINGKYPVKTISNAAYAWLCRSSAHMGMLVAERHSKTRQGLRYKASMERILEPET